VFVRSVDGPRADQPPYQLTNQINPSPYICPIHPTATNPPNRQTDRQTDNQTSMANKHMTSKQAQNSEHLNDRIILLLHSTNRTHTWRAASSSARSSSRLAAAVSAVCVVCVFPLSIAPLCVYIWVGGWLCVCVCVCVCVCALGGGFPYAIYIYI
jgi:hypothetical protein